MDDADSPEGNDKTNSFVPINNVYYYFCFDLA